MTDNIKILVAIVGLISTTIFAILGFNRSVSEFKYKSQQELKQPFREKRLQYYTEITNIIGQLMSENDPEKWNDAEKNFRRLYWGSLYLYESETVEAKMVKLGEKLDLVKDNKLMVTDQEFIDAVYDVREACKHSLQVGWNLESDF